MTSWRLAWRLLRRDWHAGELRMLALAIVVAVAAVTAVDFFADRIDGAMNAQASEVLAADLLVESKRALPAQLAELANDSGLQSASSISFPTVLVNGDASQLVQVKAVSQSYPLRGTMTAAVSLDTDPVAKDQGPAQGTIWIEPRLADLLAVNVGDRLQLGYVQLAISAILHKEPDRAANIFRLSPRVLMNEQDLPATQLMGPASRATHVLMVAGASAALDQFKQKAQPILPLSGRIVGVKDARPELRSALDRGDRFLRLTAVSAVLLALVAVALASRRFVDRQSDASALMRCLGASSGLVAKVFTLRVLAFGIIASLVGALLGSLAQLVLAKIAEVWFAQPLPPPSFRPWLTGVGIGVLVLAATALPAVWRLGQVSPLRVFRRELGTPGVSVGLAALFLIGALVGLIVWQIGDDALAGRLLGGLAAALLLFWLVAWAALRLLRLLRGKFGRQFRFAVAGLLRQPRLTTVQLIGFSFGLTALLLLAVVRTQLLVAWQGSLPQDAPNLFLLNIQPHQLADVQKHVEGSGRGLSGPFPMLRARWTAHNDQPINADNYDSANAKRMAEREFNLSWSAQLSPDNRLVQGEWWDGARANVPAFSIEQRMAKRLNIKLGDRLRYDIAGRTVEAPVASIRSVQWDSFNVNFFVVASPATLKDYPANYIASFHLPETERRFLNQLNREFPNVSAIDVGALMGQVRDIMDRGALAVEAVFAFTLLAGLVVMAAGIQASRETRRQEAALLRTFGQSKSALLKTVATEFALLGGLSGLLAASAATAISYTLATGIFDLPWQFDPWLWLISVFGGILLLTAAGLLSVRGLVNTPPIRVLRES